MPNAPPTRSNFKRLRCRYFDEEDGTPIYPGCSQGINCRFIHPTDRNWTQVASSIRGTRERELPSGHDQHRLHVDQHAHDKTSKRRSSPLPPQADLFIRRCGEGVDVDFLDDGRSSVQPREEGAVVKQEGRDLDASQQRLVFRQGPEMDLPPSAMNGVSGIAPSVTVTEEQVQVEEPTVMPLPQRLLGVFNNYCKISSQVLQDIAQVDRENSTLRTYCEILSKLSCISPSAAGAVTTTLSGVLQKHSASQERLTEGYRLMSALWETACGLFTREIAESFEIHYRKLADDFNMAQESTMADVFTPAKSIKAPASHVEERHSRSTLTTADSKRKESTNSNYSGERKRRKLSVDTTERTKDHRRKRASTSSIDEVADMLDMKTKLEDLAKENKELRACLRRREGRSPERR